MRILQKAFSLSDTRSDTNRVDEIRVEVMCLQPRIGVNSGKQHDIRPLRPLSRRESTTVLNASQL